MSFSSFRGATLKKANLGTVDLRGSNLDGAYIEGAVLNRANLCGASLIEAKLIEACLLGADFTAAKLNKADLSGTKLNGSRLQLTDLSGADLSNSKMIRTQINDTNLQGCDLSGSDLSRSYLCHSDLSGANLEKAEITAANLLKVNLNKVNLQGANLSRAYLAYADLRAANLNGADLRSADVTGLEWDDDTRMRVTMFGGNLGLSDEQLTDWQRKGAFLHYQGNPDSNETNRRNINIKITVEERHLDLLDVVLKLERNIELLDLYVSDVELVKMASHNYSIYTELIQQYNNVELPSIRQRIADCLQDFLDNYNHGQLTHWEQGDIDDEYQNWHEEMRRIMGHWTIIQDHCLNLVRGDSGF